MSRFVKEHRHLAVFWTQEKTTRCPDGGRGLVSLLHFRPFTSASARSFPGQSMSPAERERRGALPFQLRRDVLDGSASAAAIRAQKRPGALAPGRPRCGARLEI